MQTIIKFVGKTAGKSTRARKKAPKVAMLMEHITLAIKNDAGEGFVDVLVKMLIVVVVGAVLLAIMQTAVPQLFTDILTKVRGIFSV